MYSPLENPVTDPSEIRLGRRGKMKKGICLVLIVLNLIFLSHFPDHEKDLTGLHQGLLVLPILAAAVIVHEVILFSEEFLVHKNSRHERKFSSLCSATFKHSSYALITLLLFAVIVHLSDFPLKSRKTVIFCLLCAVILGSIEGLRSHNGAALNSMLKEKHLSQVWAEGAYTAYYSKVLEDLVIRATEFERIHEVKLAIKKLVLVIPLSCNVSGTFDEHHPDIKYIDDLPLIVNDQGANMNRRYKNPVYKVTPKNRRPFYLAMEQPSSILMICRLKKRVAEDILRYQRDSFILKMQEKFEDHPGLVFVYDDTNLRDQVPLAEFLFRKVAEQVGEVATDQ